MKELNVKGKIILGIAAHPDDLDFGASGTILKLIRSGAKVYYLILTDGTRGSEDLSISGDKLRLMRHREQINAGKVLGLEDVYFLDYPDGKLFNNEHVQRDVVRVIRKVKPDVVISTDPTYVYDEESGFINHPDHRNAGQIALDCVFPFARNSRSYPELLEEGHQVHVVSTVLLTNFYRGSYFIDITDCIDTKYEVVKQHVSQYNDFENIKEWIKKRAEKLGKKAGVKYAEGFIRISPQPHGL